MIAEGKVGPQLLSDGVQSELRQGRLGEQILSELHGRYYEQTFRKNCFSAYAAAVATSLVGTAMVGLQVWNSSGIGTGVNLALTKIGGMVIVTTAAATSLVLAVGAGQFVAPGTATVATRQGNNFIGGPAGSGLAYNIGTFTNAPVAIMNLMHNTAAIAVTGEDPGFAIDLEGCIIIPPQYYVCIASVGAAIGASGSNLHIMWEEVPC